MSEALESINGLIVPLLNDPLLLPNVAVAELVGYRLSQAANQGPEWFLGWTQWRDQPVPMVDLDALRAAVTDRTRVILINSPHNPTGMVLDREALELIVELAHRHDAWIVSDEVYEHLVFDDALSSEGHVPLASLPGMRERTLTLSSVGKSWSFTGWKVGWATGPAPLVAAVLAAKQWLTFTSGSPLQPAVAHALDHEPDWPLELARDLQARRDLLLDGLRSVGLAPRTSEGTYFTVTDVEHLGWEDGRAFSLGVAERAGVVPIPLQGFYAGDPAAGRHLARS